MTSLRPLARSAMRCSPGSAHAAMWFTGALDGARSKFRLPELRCRFRGSALLLGGDPGIGKSTLLLEVAASFARSRHRAVYISGEEAVAQIRLRAERLDLAETNVELAAETSVEDI